MPFVFKRRKMPFHNIVKVKLEEHVFLLKKKLDELNFLLSSSFLLHGKLEIRKQIVDFFVHCCLADFVSGKFTANLKPQIIHHFNRIDTSQTSL